MSNWEVQTYPAPITGKTEHKKFVVYAMSFEHALELAQPQIEEGYLIYSINKIWD
jgi:hypothetical protein